MSKKRKVAEIICNNVWRLDVMTDVKGGYIDVYKNNKYDSTVSDFNIAEATLLALRYVLDSDVDMSRKGLEEVRMDFNKDLFKTGKK